MFGRNSDALNEVVRRGYLRGLLNSGANYSDIRDINNDINNGSEHGYKNLSDDPTSIENIKEMLSYIGMKRTGRTANRILGEIESGIDPEEAIRNQIMKYHRRKSALDEYRWVFKENVFEEIPEENETVFGRNGIFMKSLPDAVQYGMTGAVVASLLVGGASIIKALGPDYAHAQDGSYTLDEIKKAAEEAGMDPDAITNILNPQNPNSVIEEPVDVDIGSNSQYLELNSEAEGIDGIMEYNSDIHRTMAAWIFYAFQAEKRNQGNSTEDGWYWIPCDKQIDNYSEEYKRMQNNTEIEPVGVCDCKDSCSDIDKARTWGRVYDADYGNNETDLREDVMRELLTIKSDYLNGSDESKAIAEINRVMGEYNLNPFLVALNDGKEMIYFDRDGDCIAFDGEYIGNSPEKILNMLLGETRSDDIGFRIKSSHGEFIDTGFLLSKGVDVSKLIVEHHEPPRGWADRIPNIRDDSDPEGECGACEIVNIYQPVSTKNGGGRGGNDNGGEGEGDGCGTGGGDAF